MSFGERLAALREGKTLTQNELAQLTKISRSRLSLYETNKREPDLQTTKQLADFFNVTIDFLVGRDNTTTFPPVKEEKKNHDLIKFLGQAEVLYNNMILTEEDKAKIKASLEIIFWDEIQKNKRRKS